MACRNRPVRSGFTLIEVLVVVAIIALLVAILMPSLQRAREQAWNSQCLSNLHQIGLSMHAYAAEYKDYVPRGGNHSTIHFSMFVARSVGYVKRLDSKFGQPFERYLNQLDVEHMPIFHCADRVRDLPHPFIDYLVNAMPDEAPRTAGDQWGQLIDPTQTGMYQRPGDVIYIADTEREINNVQSFGNPTLRKAREQWKAGHDLWPANPGGADAIWQNGGIDVVDAWRGAHLPQGKGSTPDRNISDAPGFRRVARKLHLKRFTNASFFDGHADGVSTIQKATRVEEYAYWLRLFGVRDAAAVAVYDDME